MKKSYYTIEEGFIIHANNKKDAIKNALFYYGLQCKRKDLLTEKQYLERNHNFLKEKYKKDYKGFYINLATGEIIKAKNKIQAFILFTIDYKKYNLKVRFKDIQAEYKRMGSLRK